MTEGEYIRRMEAAIIPEARDILLLQFDAFYDVGFEISRERPDKETPEIRACSLANANLDMLVRSICSSMYKLKTTA